MDPVLISALIALFSTAVGSWFTYLGTRSKSAQAKLNELDARIRVLETRERILWKYCQDLILHINQGKPPPAPDWPSELNDLN